MLGTFFRIIPKRTLNQTSIKTLILLKKKKKNRALDFSKSNQTGIMGVLLGFYVSILVILVNFEVDLK